MKFDYVRLSDAIKYKMLDTMVEQKRKLGVRDIAPLIGISTATLSRCYNGAKMDVDTLVLLLKWLGEDFKEFINE